MKKKKNYTGSYSPQLRERSHFGTKYRKAPHREKEKKNQKSWGSRGLQAWPETGS
jgi:hypothetical protein